MSNPRMFLSPPWMSGRERALVDEVFASNYIAPCGPMVERFEREFADQVGLPYACALSSCTAALDLLFHELGTSRGDSVVCSDLTFVASIAPAVQRGAEPVFIDADPTTWTMDAGLLREALADAAKAGRLPKAVVAVDLYGQCCDYDAIDAACAEHGVPLIIDSAEALGAQYWGKGSGHQAVGRGGRAESCESGARCCRHAGEAGWASVYSFNGNKIVTTSGGGMLASRDKRLVDLARKRSQQAREPAVWYEHKELGYNYRMSNVVAAIGVGQLQVLDAMVEKRRQIHDWYREGLGALEQVHFMPEAATGRAMRWLTVVQIESEARGRRSESRKPAETVMRVIEALEKENIESRPVWKPMHLQPVFRGKSVYGGAVSERVFESGLCLPSGTGMTQADVGRVSGIVAGALQT